MDDLRTYFCEQPDAIKEPQKYIEYFYKMGKDIIASIHVSRFLSVTPA